MKFKEILVKEAMLPSDTTSGDILMSSSTGAYTFAMASNYNRVPNSWNQMSILKMFYILSVQDEVRFLRDQLWGIKNLINFIKIPSMLNSVKYVFTI